MPGQCPVRVICCWAILPLVTAVAFVAVAFTTAAVHTVTTAAVAAAPAESLSPHLQGKADASCVVRCHQRRHITCIYIHPTQQVLHCWLQPALREAGLALHRC